MVLQDHFRPIELDGNECLDIWPEKLAVGATLPLIPLWLRGEICLAVELIDTPRQTGPGIL